MGSIEVSGLTKWFRTGPAVVRDLSFRYEGSGAIGYIGPNGAGKTTTLKLLVGLLRPSRGKAFLNGTDPTAHRKEALWDVGALIESPEPYPTLQVHGALDAVGRARGLSRDDVDREIDRCHELLGLPPLEARIGWLSKGQRQRVALAATLMGDPSVLLLDEPTSGLDPGERVIVRRMLGRLKRDHLVFLSSHQLLEVSEVCDQVVFLHYGRVVLRDSIERLEARLRTRQMDVEFERAVAPGAMEALRPLATELTPVSDRRWRIVFDGSEEARVGILERCQRVGSVVRFGPASLALEEAYLDTIPNADAPA